MAKMAAEKGVKKSMKNVIGGRPDPSADPALTAKTETDAERIEAERRAVGILNKYNSLVASGPVTPPPNHRRRSVGRFEYAAALRRRCASPGAAP